MTLLGALDVGNSTTEVLLAEVGDGRVEPLWDGRAPTIGRKGGPESLASAAELLAAGEARVGACQELMMTTLVPVESLAVSLCGPTQPSTPARALRAQSTGTVAGVGVAVGSHLPLSALDRCPVPGPVVVSVPAGVDFEVAASSLRSAFGRGWEIVGALVAGDDAVLIHNRIDRSIPIVDEVELNGLPDGARVVLEVARPGHPLTTLGDPIALAAALELPPSATFALAPVARLHVDVSSGAVATYPTCATSGGSTDDPGAWIELEGEGRVPLLPATSALLAEHPVGAARRVRLAAELGPADIADAFAVDLDAVDSGGWVRRGIVHADALPLATLAADAVVADARDRMEALSGRPVRIEIPESRAARCGALSTPGVSSDAAVLDIGGGTIDLASATKHVIAAGAGSLLTTAVAASLAIPMSLAETIKRGPAVRVAAPQLVHREDGTREFLAAPVDAAVVGQLARIDDGELIAFRSALAPEEWRGLRLRLKEQTVGVNVERLLRGFEHVPQFLLTAGGAAEDEEIVRSLGERLRARGVVVGRANVGGRFGPRHAVTYGLLAIAASEET